ncbi:MAG: hypothetical protein KF683_05180 [Rubrivivax sp.]|nr:hypothetical protein [Rubrivivax sp.]
MTTKSSLPPIPPILADVALVDGPTCAATCGLSLSAWHELVRKHHAPQPAVRRPRYTRWRAADIRKFVAELPTAVTPEAGSVGSPMPPHGKSTRSDS